MPCHFGGSHHVPSLPRRDRRRGPVARAPTATPACPLCNPTGTTFANEVAQADFILYGTLSNAKPDPKDPDALNKGTTDLAIDVVIKSHDMVKGKKSITIPRYVPPDRGKNIKYLIFFNVTNGQLDPVSRRGSSRPTATCPSTSRARSKSAQKDIVTRLRYFFNYLEDKDIVISSDAYNEFAVADYKEVSEVATKLPAATILKWLKDPNTRGSRFGLYGLMLGHCGKPADAKAIRELLDDKERSFSSGLDGVLAGYIMLDPEAGWDYLVHLVKSESEFPVKYAGLRTARVFWEFRPDLIPHKQVLEVMKTLMDQPDIADMPIEDLRKWKVWDLTPLVLSYANEGLAQHDPDQQPRDPEVRHRRVVGRSEEHSRRRTSSPRPRRKTPDASSSWKNCSRTR